MSLRCHGLWGHVVWFKVWRCGGPKNCSVLRQYYKVLLQYYSVLHSTTSVLLCTTQYYNVLLCTTKYYASTTLYYKVLLQYNSVLQRTTPVPQRTTHFQWAEQVKSPFKLSKYCACHAKWIASLIRITYETSFPMRGASKVTLQTQQILRLPYKMNLIIDPLDI